MFFKRLIRNKKWLIIILIIATILIILLGTKTYLYVNFLLGNDIVIKLDVDKEYLYLKHGEWDIVEFQTRVTTNPFCSATCKSKFISLNDMNVLDRSSFSIKPGKSHKQTYQIKAKETGIGKDIYNYGLECESSGGFLCHSDFETSNRNLLIIAEYDFNDYEKTLKKEFEETALLLTSEIGMMKTSYLSLKNSADELNQTVVVDFNLTYEDKLDELDMNLTSLAFRERYFLYLDELKKIRNEIDDFRIVFDELEDSIIGNISSYNDLVDDLFFIRNIFYDLNYSSQTELYEVTRLSEEFNLVVDGFSNRNTLETKEGLVENLAFDISNYSNLSIFGGEVNASELGLREINFSEIEIKKIEPQDIPIEFFSYEPMCCVDKNCTRCCVGNECRDSAATFPVVFLHGHSVTKDLPLEYSLEGFRVIQDKLEGDRYLNAGAITLYTSKDVPAGIWNFNFPISIRGSYYFDFFEEPENYRIVLTKSENIDTYAVRLKEVFDNIRFRTGKDKVNVVAFSMGGLVIRRHMQLFGSDGFDKVILVGTPNKGISGEVSTLCPLAGGEKRECDDMNSESLFMQKLNRDKIPDNLYNIYGTGCAMDDGMGDGIVLEDKTRLDIQNNFVINGTCRGKFRPLHLDLLKIDMYPEVYEIIKEILEKNI